ncbi:MAG: hypothetical protein IEMM0008_0219 [bacterium]|nr:MAG: hypothetical protein IEMM0008_0219 [bacterium]
MQKAWYLSILILVSLSASVFAQDKFHYYNRIYVKTTGQIVAEERFQTDLGHYLFRLGNHNIYKAKIRDGLVIEFNTPKSTYYVVYNDDGKIRELGGKKGKMSDISHIYHYNKKGHVKEVNHFRVDIDFKYFPISSTYFHYDKENRLTKEVTKDTKGKTLSKTIYQLGSKGKISRKEYHSKGTIKSYITYQYNSSNQLIGNKLYDSKKKLIQSTRFYYNAKGKLERIVPKVFRVEYYKTIKKKVLETLGMPEGITEKSLVLNGKGLVVSMEGTLPNVQSYITYSFKYLPSLNIMPSIPLKLGGYDYNNLLAKIKNPGDKKFLKKSYIPYLPRYSRLVAFESEILSKLSDPKVKEFVLSCYIKDNKWNNYVLKDNLPLDKRSRLFDLLLLIQYTKSRQYQLRDGVTDKEEFRIVKLLHSVGFQKAKNVILASFKNFSADGKIRLNTVRMVLRTDKRKVVTLKTDWYNQKGEEVFHKVPREIRFSRTFDLLTLLNTKHLIFGKVETQDNKYKIYNEIIVEIYDKANQRDWCYFSGGHFYFIIFHHKKPRKYNKIQILKAGYGYKTIKFQMDRGETIIDLSTTYLKIAYNRENQ